MANGYYLVTELRRLAVLEAAAPRAGLPHELFSVRYSADGSQAIVQAEWPEKFEPPAGVSWLGAHNPDGSAELVVHEELVKTPAARRRWAAASAEVVDVEVAPEGVVG